MKHGPMVRAFLCNLNINKKDFKGSLFIIVDLILVDYGMAVQ